MWPFTSQRTGKRYFDRDKNTKGIMKKSNDEKVDNDTMAPKTENEHPTTQNARKS